MSSACHHAWNVTAAGILADMSLRARSCLRVRGSGEMGLGKGEKVQECQRSLKRRLQPPLHSRHEDSSSVLGLFKLLPYYSGC